MRTMRTMAGPSPLARAGWVAGGGNKRCMSTVYAESHEYLTKVRTGGAMIPVRSGALCLYLSSVLGNSFSKNRCFLLASRVCNQRHLSPTGSRARDVSHDFILSRDARWYVVHTCVRRDRLGYIFMLLSNANSLSCSCWMDCFAPHGCLTTYHIICVYPLLL